MVWKILENCVAQSLSPYFFIANVNFFEINVILSFVGVDPAPTK